MRTVTLDQAVDDLKNIIQRTIQDKDETVIASNEGAVVMLGACPTIRAYKNLGR